MKHSTVVHCRLLSFFPPVIFMDQTFISPAFQLLICNTVVAFIMSSCNNISYVLLYILINFFKTFIRCNIWKEPASPREIILIPFYGAATEKLPVHCIDKSNRCLIGSKSFTSLPSSQCV